MASLKLTFVNSSGQRLAGLRDAPSTGRPRAAVLFAHCFTCTKDVRGAVYLSRALADAGLAVLRFDFTGLGDSGGDFGDTNFSSNVSDLVDAARFLQQRGEPPELLVGHSLGGAAVIHAAARIPSCRAVATIGTPADLAHVTRHFGHRLDEIAERGRAEVMLDGRPFTIGRQFVEDLGQNRMQAAVADLDKPLLVLHAPLDDVVGIENAGRIFQTARHPKSFVSLDTADHLLSRREDARYAGQLIAAWAGRYLTANH